jgi:hypothetical protein
MSQCNRQRHHRLRVITRQGWLPQQACQLRNDEAGHEVLWRKRETAESAVQRGDGTAAIGASGGVGRIAAGIPETS